MNEPEIRINGRLLNEAEAMTIRVALGAYAMDLKTNGLGEDETGIVIKEGYLRNISSIFKLMF